MTAAQEPSPSNALPFPLLPVSALIPLVSREVGAIAKIGENTQQHFNFRGIDHVLNAFHPVFAKHGIFVAPRAVLERRSESRDTARGGSMNVVHLHVQFAVVGPVDEMFVEAWGEAQDSADKATNKAHSIAYKNAMLQTFTVPVQSTDVDDPDRDGESTTARPAGWDPTDWQAGWTQALGDAGDKPALTDVWSALRGKRSDLAKPRYEFLLAEWTKRRDVLQADGKLGEAAGA